MTKKSVYVKTFGCQMNIRDSEFAAGILLDSGFRLTDSAETADVVLFNSCSVRKHAEDRLFSNIWDLKGLKLNNKDLVIGLIGCTAQNYKEKVFKKAPMVDFVCGPGNEGDLSEIISEVLKTRRQVIATDKVDEKRPEGFPQHRVGKFKALVSISEGCENFCSYCVVPYVRGKERSRDAEDIIREVKDLASRGFKEITLLGQNVNSYQGTGYRVPGTENRTRTPNTGSRIPTRDNFIRLLEQLNAIKGIERIRFMTSHPKDASVELFKAMRDLDKVCGHLHLPLQSGSGRILKLMNRGYTRKRYLEVVENYRSIVSGGSITTDCIVGFPSESEKDFKDTYDIMKKVGFDSSFLFKYSPRPPAKAAAFKDDVPKDVKQARLKALLDLQTGICLRKNKPLEGKVAEILVDGHNKKDPAFLSGRTRTNKVAVFKGRKTLTGKIVKVRVNSVTPYALKGRVVK